MNVIQGTKKFRQQWNQLLDAVVTIFRYKKITIDCAIYIKVLSDGKVPYLVVSTDDFFNTTINETALTELRRFLENIFTLKSKKDVSLST